MHLSFEIFPPKTPQGYVELCQRYESLSGFPVDFLSVTSGTMGTKAGDMLDVLSFLSSKIHIPMVPHITCTYGTKPELNDLADELWSKGYRTLVVLRGDMPKGFRFSPDHCHYANELIELIKKRHDFQIYVAAYPEIHPEAASRDADLMNLKRKVDAGATAIFTQFFFDPTVFFTFRDHVKETGIDVPIIAGLIPLFPYQKVKNFANKCRAEIPEAVANIFRDQQDAKEASLYLQEQCQQLVSGGVDGFHFYCLNRPDLIINVLQKLTF